MEFLHDRTTAYAWQVQHDGRTQMTIHDPASAHLPLLYPRAYGFLREGATEVKVLSLEGMLSWWCDSAGELLHPERTGS